VGRERVRGLTWRTSISAAEASMGAGAAATKAAKRVVKMIEARILMVLGWFCWVGRSGEVER
jgi:hypothetical protein